MDLSAYSKELQANSDHLLTLLYSIEETKLSEKPSNEWSILEIAEHIYRADKPSLMSLHKLLKNITIPKK